MHVRKKLGLLLMIMAMAVLAPQVSGQSYVPYTDSPVVTSSPVTTPSAETGGVVADTGLAQCPVSESTRIADAEKEISRLLRQYRFLSLEILPGSAAYMRTIAGERTGQLTPIMGRPESDNALGIDCILLLQETWFQIPGGEAPWTPVGLWPQILFEDNNFTVSEIQAQTLNPKVVENGQRQWVQYRPGDARFLVGRTEGQGFEFRTTHNPYAPRTAVTAVEFVEFYGFNQNPAPKVLHLRVGEVPGFSMALEASPNSNPLQPWCGSDAVLTCAPEFYYALTQDHMDIFFNSLYSRRQISPSEPETPVAVNRQFLIPIQQFGQRKMMVGRVLQMDNQAVTWLQIWFWDEADMIATPEHPVAQWILTLFPNCDNMTELWTGTCGRSIPYCQGDTCGFQQGLEEIRRELQNSNVSTTNSLKELVRGWINFALGFLFLLAVVVIIVSGVMLVANFGNDDTISKAKKMIIYAVVGLVLIVLAYPIVNTLINAVQ